MSRGLPVCRRLPGHPGRLAIVGSSPSAKRHVTELSAFDEVWAVNGAYDWLQSLGLVADGFVAMDPVAGLADYVKNAAEKTTFYLSSVCDPSVFDALTGHKVALWHSKMDGVEYAPDTMLIGGGTTTISRAPYLANMLGWRDITLFGCDSSYDADERYCYRHGSFAEDTQRPVIWVDIGDQTFPTELQMVHQATQLAVMQTHFQGQLKFRCGGLMDALLKAPIQNIEEAPQSWA